MHIYPQKACIRMFIRALFLLARNWKLFKHPSTLEWTSRLKLHSNWTLHSNETTQTTTHTQYRWSSEILISCWAKEGVTGLFYLHKIKKQAVIVLGGSDNQKRVQKCNSGTLHMFCFLIGCQVRELYTSWKLIQLYTCYLWTSLYVCYTSIQSLRNVVVSKSRNWTDSIQRMRSKFICKLVLPFFRKFLIDSAHLWFKSCELFPLHWNHPGDYKGLFHSMYLELLSSLSSYISET